MKEKNSNVNGNANEKKKVKVKMNPEKKFYLFTAAGCAAILVAIIVVALVVSNTNKIDQVDKGNPQTSAPADSSSAPDDSSNEPVIVTPEGMIMPLETVSVSNEFGFYYNQTLNSYYEHDGIDFAAAAGTAVFAVESGTIESIYKDDLLSGTEIVINHGDGLKTVYRFVTEAEGLKVGMKVEKGDVIATVAEANGDEYKDGAHLHFEVRKNGKIEDPALHLTLEEK